MGLGGGGGDGGSTDAPDTTDHNLFDLDTGVAFVVVRAVDFLSGSGLLDGLLVFCPVEICEVGEHEEAEWSFRFLEDELDSSRSMSRCDGWSPSPPAGRRFGRGYDHRRQMAGSRCTCLVSGDWSEGLSPVLILKVRWYGIRAGLIQALLRK